MRSIKNGNPKLSAAKDLLLHRISGIFPGFNPSPECRCIMITVLDQFICLTGSACFIVSGTVKNDLLLS